MHIKFTQAARKHRIGKARVAYLIENYEYQVLKSDDEKKIQYVWVAEDVRGIELEVIGVVLESYVLITHVMPTSFRRRKKQWRIK